MEMNALYVIVGIGGIILILMLISKYKKTQKLKAQSMFLTWNNEMKNSLNKADFNTIISNQFRPDQFYKQFEDDLRIVNQRKIMKYHKEYTYEDSFVKNLLEHQLYLSECLNNTVQNFPLLLKISQCIKEVYKLMDLQTNELEQVISYLQINIDDLNMKTKFCEINGYGNVVIKSEDEREIDLRMNQLVNNFELHRNNINKIKPLAVLEKYHIIREAASLMWFYAQKKPIDVPKFTIAKDIFNFFTANVYYDNNQQIVVGYAEEILARVYLKNNMGGQQLAGQEMEYIEKCIEYKVKNNDFEDCYLLASGLAWMECYDLELNVLRLLVQFNIDLPVEIQERISILESGFTHFKIYEVDNSNDYLFDTSAIEWKKTDFQAFFKNVFMKKCNLGYALALKQWKKTIPLEKGQKINDEMIKNQFFDMLEDFDGDIHLKIVNAHPVNVHNINYNNAFLFDFSANLCKHMSVLFTYEKFGRNLNLCIYTLFTLFDSTDVDYLTDYVLSIRQSPYVESFQESILQVLDNVLKKEEIPIETAVETESSFI